METSKEEPVAKRLRSRIVNMETSVAKRPRLEPLSDKEIIKNLKARIRHLEEQLKIQSILVPDLPNEIWLKIMSYLSTFDLLRNVAQVSKKFNQLSKDPYLIRKIQLNSESWAKDQVVEYSRSIGKVLTRSRNLTFFSFEFPKHNYGKMFVWALHHLNRYCQKLKRIKLEYKPSIVDSGLNHEDLIWKKLSILQETIITSLEQNNFIEEFEMNGFKIDLDKLAFKKVLETLAEKFPKLQRLCLSTGLYAWRIIEWDEYAEICQSFVSSKNIKLEIRGLPERFVTVRPFEKLLSFSVIHAKNMLFLPIEK